MASLEETINNAAKAPVAPKHTDGETRLLSIDLLDDNPFQPRVKMDSSELEELVESLSSKGQIQAIVVRPKSDGRYITVAGHRRVAAFRRIRDNAADADKGKWSRINATIRLALDDAQLASIATRHRSRHRRHRRRRRHKRKSHNFNITNADHQPHP